MRGTIEMAREAGLEGMTGHPALQRLVALVRADALANIDPSKMMSYQEGFEAGRFAEREACAKVIDAAKADEVDWDSNDWNQAVEFCATRIRARGNT